MMRTKFFEILRYNRITKSWPDEQTLWLSTKNENRTNSVLCCSCGPQENEKRDKYLDLSTKLKKLWNMKVTVISIVIGALARVTKGLVQGLEKLEIRGRMETIHATSLLISVGILRIVLETWGGLAVTQTSGKSHQLMLVRKFPKEIIIMISASI